MRAQCGEPGFSDGSPTEVGNVPCMKAKTNRFTISWCVLFEVRHESANYTLGISLMWFQGDGPLKTLVHTVRDGSIITLRGHDTTAFID